MVFPKKTLQLIRVIFVTMMLFVTAVACVAPLRSESGEIFAGLGIEGIDAAGSISRVRRPDGIEEEDYVLLKAYARELDLDYRLILAVIKQESRFDHEAVSDRGATGLMQLMPVTHAELTEKFEIADSHLPAGNIKAGMYYLASLVELFRNSSGEDRIRLALAAYNAGPGRVYDAQELSAYIGENPNSWSAIQNALPLLSRRYYSLHEGIWENGRPRNGYFGSWKQTVIYVERVMEAYEAYRGDT